MLFDFGTRASLLRGFAGDDRLDGFGGNDTLEGGDGSLANLEDKSIF